MEYEKYIANRILAGLFLFILIFMVSVFSISQGGYNLSIDEVIRVLIGRGDYKSNMIIWNIRFPRVLAGILVGASLAISGAVMQGFLRNPLASPFTMGVSHGAMFGASIAILLGAGYSESSGKIIVNNPYAVVLFAFLGAMSAAAIILLLAKLKGLSPEAIILSGIAMSSLFVALTTLIQYFADELQLAAMVYWSFGDLGRTTWREDIMLGISFTAVFTYFIMKRWDLNASALGDEIAKSVGVEVEKTRVISTFLATFLTAISVSFVGVIGFVGLITPHAVRLLFGGDYRFLIPLSALMGAFLLLTADTIARLLFSPITLPVGVVTPFLGAPMFIYLLVRMEGGR